MGFNAAPNMSRSNQAQILIDWIVTEVGIMW